MIKRLLTFTLVALGAIVFSISCASKTENKNEQITQNKEMKNDGKKLVVFFSHTGENYNVGFIEKGNTHIVADMIADATGADRFEIVPTKAYPVDYNECIEIAKKEKQADARMAM